MNLLPGLPDNITAFLFVLATTPGSFFSQFDKIKWFAALTTGQKLMVQVGLSGLAAALLTVLAAPTLPAGTLDHVNGVYLVIVQVITAIAANFGTYIGVNVLAKPAGTVLTAKAKEEGPKG